VHLVTMKFRSSGATNRDLFRKYIPLVAVVPATSIGALASTVIAPGIIGQTIAICCGIWMVVFPIYWCQVIERQPIDFNLTNSGSGLGVGILLGVGMFGLILGSYEAIGKYWLDLADIRARVDRLQMNVPLMVFGFGTFQTLVNSFIEEYIWRWFVFQKCELIVGNRVAVWLSALFFTLHHIILLIAYCNDLKLLVTGSIAVFLAGVIWARCFAIYRSLLPVYLSHLAADLALQIISWQVLLG
jgi:uncharacterized protein